VTFPPKLPLRLVIFDCDGVLVDSEAPSNRAVAEEVSKLGWPIDEAESMRRFTGFRLEQIAPLVEMQLGRMVPDGWVETVRRRIIEILSRELRPVPGAREAIRVLDLLGVPYRVASNSSQQEMRVKFARAGMLPLLERAHSADDVGIGKPAPDVFQQAARAEGVPPAACLVIEDSLPGATAAKAACMACLGYAPHGDGQALRDAGATVIRSLGELPALFRAASRYAA
jgi:HAD superfamily hydrolase (TIGR01509 family)